MKKEVLDRYKDMWSRVIEQFDEKFPELSQRVDMWYPSGQFEITVILDDDRRFAYDSLFDNLRPVYDVDMDWTEDYYDESEDDCKFEFATRLRRRMKLHGITPTGLAERLNVSTGTMNNYLNGKAIPNVHILRKLARTLKCSILEFTDF